MGAIFFRAPFKKRKSMNGKVTSVASTTTPLALTDLLSKYTPPPRATAPSRDAFAQISHGTEDELEKALRSDAECKVFMDKNPQFALAVFKLGLVHLMWEQESKKNLESARDAYASLRMR